MSPHRLMIATLVIAALAASTQLQRVFATDAAALPHAQVDPQANAEIGAAAARAGELLRVSALSSTPKSAELAQLAAWSEHQVATPDGLLAYTSIGQGPVLLVIPGGPGGSSYGLRSRFLPLAKDFNIVLVDNIGRGRSARLADPARYTVERDAQDIEHLRRFLGVKTLALYGHSYGGLVAQAYAAQYPQAVDHLILGNTLHGERSWQAQIDGFKAWLQRHDPERWQRLLVLHEQGQLTGSAQAQDLIGAVFEPLYWANRAAERPKAVASGDPRDAMNKTVYLAMLGPDPEWRVGGTLQGVELLPRLKAVTAPTLLLTGRFDAVAPPSVMMEMKQALVASAGASAVVFEHSGHRPFAEEPSAWAKAVSEFMQSRAN
ncbi:alpha/beta hydrolase [Paucibacter sp. TC2R-5]|uniref:alpha/beta hydrolase n=1 Tax=Paucibacter sp. TC2R-5 TaxID=2893555 RepID=UPI0021E466A0|nr:alpha/beta hydrolase [Paucibacter sp. TC2R-5]MCV2360100.1 alpha/beta hydrolase [Paucibacter sp. TC2R-5]